MPSFGFSTYIHTWKKLERAMPNRIMSSEDKALI